MTRTRACVVLMVVGGASAAALGQTAQVFTDPGLTTPMVMNFSLTFAEYNSATLQPVTQSNGSIDPGEAAYTKLTISTTPLPTFSGTNPATAAYWNPAVVGGSGHGWLWGIGGMFVDVVGDGGASSAQGTWALTDTLGSPLRGVIGAWAVGDTTTMGTPTQGGARMSNIQAGQFNSNLLNLSTHDPVVNIWRGLWTPSSLDGRNVVFTVANNSAGVPDASVMLADSTFPQNTIPLGAFTGVNFGSVSIPIGVPAPGAWVLLGFAGAAAGPRRRARTVGRAK
jgi:hypothetical protein